MRQKYYIFKYSSQFIINMDKKDQSLIRIMEKEGKLSSRKLALKTGLPISTAHRRVRKLEKEGIIKGYRAIVDYQKTNRPIPILVFINLEETNKKEKYTPISKIKEELSKIRDIYEVFFTQGGKWDLIVKARLEKLKNTNQFMEKIRQIKGIEEVSSSIISEEVLF
jgi:DNA-binding Lrp family transcriptional regulator